MANKKIILLCCLVATLAVFFFNFSAGVAPLDSSVINQTQPSTKPVHVPRELNSSGPKANSLICDVSEFPSFSRGDAKMYFDKMGVNAKTLTTVYWLTHDYEYLVKLQELAGDSLPAISTLATELKNEDDRIFWGEKLLKLDPKSNAGYLCLMQAYVKKGDFKKALELMHKANDSPNSNQYEEEKLLDQREAWQVNGVDSWNARIRVERNDTSSIALIGQTVPAMIDLWKNLSANQSADEILGHATEFLAAAANIQKLSKYTTASKLHSLLAERAVLKLLPADTEYGDTGLTVADQLNVLKEDTSVFLKSQELVKQTIANISPDMADLYYQRVNSLGIQSANEWLLKR